MSFDDIMDAYKMKDLTKASALEKFTEYFTTNREDVFRIDDSYEQEYYITEHNDQIRECYKHGIKVPKGLVIKSKT